MSSNTSRRANTRGTSPESPADGSPDRTVQDGPPDGSTDVRDAAKDDPTLDGDDDTNSDSETDSGDETPDGYRRFRSSTRVYAYRVDEPTEVITGSGPVPAQAGDYVVKDSPDSATRLVEGDSFEDGYEED